MSEVAEQYGPGRKFRFHLGIRTDVGRKREENQDSHGHAHTSEVSVFLVADGMGGAKGGGSASAIAVDVILKSAFTQDALVTESSLRNALVRANELLHAESKTSDDLTGMGTTAVALAFVGEQLLIAHVGDSRAYLLRDGKLNRLTRDHTLVQELVDSGAIEQADAKNHPIAHMLTRSLGPTAQVEVEVMTFYDAVQADDTFLLCCDGLYNLVPDEEIAKILGEKSPPDAAEELVNLALERGGTDNITVEIIKARPLSDETFEFIVPDPGKLRMVVSRDAPPLHAKLDEKRDEEAVKNQPEERKSATERRKEKRKRAVDEVIFTQGGERKEDLEEVEAEAAPSESTEPPSEEQQAEQKEAQEFQTLKTIGLAAILLTIGVVSYLFLVSSSGREVVKQEVLVPLQPTPVVTPTPTPASHVDSERIASILNDIAPSLPTPASETIEPKRFQLSPEETKTLDGLLSLEVSPLPKLRKDYSSQDGAVATTPLETLPTAPVSVEPRILSEGEKRDLVRRKAELRITLRQLDLKLRALDSVSNSEIRNLQQAAEESIRNLESLQGRLEDDRRVLKTEQSLWETRQKMLPSVDPIRLASEVASSNASVAESNQKLKKLQQEYQEVLDRWNNDKSNQDLIAQTASLAREIKSEKATLQELVQKAVTNGGAQNAQEIARLDYTLEKIAQTLTVEREYVGFLRAAEPNIEGQNTSRLKSLVRDRSEILKRYQDYEQSLPIPAEREYLSSVLGM